METNEREVSKDIESEYTSKEMLIQTNTKAGIDSGTMSMVSSAQNFEDSNKKAKGKVSQFHPRGSQASVAMLIDNNSEEASEFERNRSVNQLQNAHEELLRDKENGSEEHDIHFLPAINQAGNN